MNMNIFGYMNELFIQKGYVALEEVSKEELINGLSLYLTQKVNEQDMDIGSLFTKYLSTKPNEHELAELIHYLLRYISIVQHFAVTWEVEDNVSPTFIYNRFYPDKINSLLTSKEIDYNEVFPFVLNKVLEISETREDIVRR